ncbi:hypothetical protein QFZ65_003481 [Arthrobacter sp. B3I9]|nr:hypothetical protein [Arthrobacter sp. B3I9]MDQ0851543.1 hypothetical protein [Arthrobacter sp. B3I9]
MLAPGDLCLVAFPGAGEKRPLLGQGQHGTLAVGLELECAERNGHALPVQEHLVGENDPFILHDVVVDGLHLGNEAAFRTADVRFAAAHPKVQAGLALVPLGRAAEPFFLLRMIREGLEDC